jgi:excisionase family DNA binding protein
VEALVESQFFTIPEMAKILKVSVSTVRRAIKSGDIVPTRVGALGQIRIGETELNRYVARATHPEGNGGTGGPAVTPVASSTPEEPPAILQAPPVQMIQGTIPSGTPWKVLTGDILDGLRALASNSVDCIVTSPPYYWQRDYEVEGQIGHESTIDAYVRSLTTAFAEARRVLAPDGVFFLNLGDTYYSAKGKPHGTDKKHNGRQMARRKLRAVDGPGLGLPRKSLIGIPWRVAFALQADGWTLRSAAIWQRPGSMPEPTATDRPHRTYEHVFIFSKGPRYFFDRAGLAGDEDIWQIVARPENPGAHFAPFPKEIVERCLACGCKPGGTVLDPFVGSGTTMLVALKKGSPAIGIDLKPEYCAFIEQRILTEFAEQATQLELPAAKRQAGVDAAD